MPNRQNNEKAQRKKTLILLGGCNDDTIRNVNDGKKRRRRREENDVLSLCLPASLLMDILSSSSLAMKCNSNGNDLSGTKEQTQSKLILHQSSKQQESQGRQQNALTAGTTGS
eukprot:7901768-Ditylum_brightwellii.AAC.1